MLILHKIKWDLQRDRGAWRMVEDMYNQVTRYRIYSISIIQFPPSCAVNDEVYRLDLDQQ